MIMKFWGGPSLSIRRMFISYWIFLPCLSLSFMVHSVSCCHCWRQSDLQVCHAVSIEDCPIICEEEESE